jgi:hypothetical protein
MSTWGGESGTGQQLPGYNIMVLGSTGLRGPRHRGRLFIPCPIESVITDGLLIEANRAEIETAWQDYRTNLASDLINWGVASYVHADFTPYTTVTVTNKLGIIRRRRNVA